MGFLDSLKTLLGGVNNTVQDGAHAAIDTARMVNPLNTSVGQGVIRQINPLDGGRTYKNPGGKPGTPFQYPLTSKLPPPNFQYAQTATAQDLPALPQMPKAPLYPINYINYPTPQTNFEEDDTSPNQYLQPVSYDSGQATLYGQALQNPLYSRNLRLK